MKHLRLQLSLIDRINFCGCPMTIITHSKSEEDGNYNIIFATKINACSKKTRSLPSPLPPTPGDTLLYIKIQYLKRLYKQKKSTLNRTHLGLNENGSTSRSRNGCNDWGDFVLEQNSSVVRCQKSSINRSRDGPTLEPARLERKRL